MLLEMTVHFLWLSSIPMYIYVPHLLYLSVDGNLGCFHGLAIINSAAMNIEVPVSFFFLIYFYFFGCVGSSFLCKGFL